MTMTKTTTAIATTLCCLALMLGGCPTNVEFDIEAEGDFRSENQINADNNGEIVFDSPTPDSEDGDSSPTGNNNVETDTRENPSDLTTPMNERDDPDEDQITNPNNTDPGNRDDQQVAPTAEFQQVVPLMFAGGEFTTTLVDDAVEMLAEAAWLAYEATGTITLTGTLSQSQGSYWNYSPLPSDRLVVAFADMPPIEFRITTFDGYFEGEPEDFAWGQHSLDFQVSQEGIGDLHVSSQAAPNGSKSSWQRQISGTVTYLGSSAQVNLSHRGTRDGYVEAPWSHSEYQETAQGTITSNGTTINVNDSYSSDVMYSGQNGPLLSYNLSIGSQSSMVIDGVIYRFDANGQPAGVRWEKVSRSYTPAMVDDADYWSVGGTLYADGTAIGTLQFSKQVIEGTQGPDLLLVLADGTQMTLHTLIE
jgi:hypothetical protein